MRNSTFSKLIAICLLFSTLPSVMALRNAIEAAQAVGLIPRATVCGGMADYKQCGPSFPSTFCCPASSTCFGVANNASVVCCPEGNTSCETINPLSCDVQFYNATAHPESPMHATNFNVQLATCGTNTCCPPGYICTNGICTVNSPTATASKASGTASATAARLTTATSAATHSPTGAAIGSNSGAPSNPNLLPSPQCEAFPTNAVLVGFFPGLIAGSLITFLFVICLGRCSKKKNNNRSLKVSDPIYHETSAARTDFLRRPPMTNHSSGTEIDSTAASTPMGRVRSLFSRTPNLSSRAWGSGEHNAEPSTPPAQLKREPSTQSITIFSPPDTRASQSTTFRDVLKAAGFHSRDSPPAFMGSPGLVDPRSRGIDGGRLR